MSNFSFVRRNPHHWDVNTPDGRVFRVRGEPGDIYLLDEREPGGSSNLYPYRVRASIRFKTAVAAMAYCVDILMTHD